MKKLIFVILCTACPIILQAQRDSASVTFLPAAGIYLLQYSVAGATYVDTLIPATKIDPEVRCQMKPIQDSGNYSYSYRLALSSSSQQYLLSFRLFYSSYIWDVQKPSSRWDVFNTPSQGSIDWSNTNIDPSGLHVERTDIGPGDSMTGFSFSSRGLPIIINSYLQGNAPGLAFTGDPPAEMSVLLDSILVFPNNSVVRQTIGPKDPMMSLMPVTFLDTLLSYTRQSADLGWLGRERDNDCDDDERPEDGVAKNIEKRLEKARRFLEREDPLQARKELEKLVQKVERIWKRSQDQDKSLMTSEAYALLKYNTDYLIDHLPERENPDKGRDKGKPDKKDRNYE